MAGEIDAVRVVDDAIEDSVGVGWIADEIVPFVDGDLTGDDGRSAAIGGRHHFRNDGRLRPESAICRLCGLASMYPTSDWSMLCSGLSWISARLMAPP